MGKADQFATLVYALSVSANTTEKAQIAAKNLLLFVAQNAGEMENALRYSEEIDKAIPEILQSMGDTIKDLHEKRKNHDGACWRQSHADCGC